MKPEGWALITGAAGGLGRALALEAARAGHDLLLADLPGTPLPALCAEIERLGVKSLPLYADLSKPEQVTALWQQATALRRVSVLVNNAGFGRGGAQGSEEDGGCAKDQRLIAVNIAAPTLLQALAIAHMRESGGRILNVASIAGFVPGPGMATYHASKSYLLSLSRATAQELAGSGISVTALCPGPIATGFYQSAGIADQWLFRLNRPSRPEDVARTGWRALMAGRREVVHGWLNWATALLSWHGNQRLNTYLSGLLIAKR